MPKVLLIAGASRGGSTLIDRLLGQLDGFQSTGELAHIWRRGLLKNQRCGCGVPFRKCRFWRDVLECGAGLKPFPPARDLVRLRRCA